MVKRKPFAPAKHNLSVNDEIEVNRKMVSDFGYFPTFNSSGNSADVNHSR